jgi:hypothetical protein
MKPTTIQSIGDLLGIVQQYANTNVIYRGVKSSEYELIPKVGRRRRKKKVLEPKDERDILSLFKQRAIEHLHRTPVDDWEWLFIAQHHRLPTRLLDWTRNPLVGAYRLPEAFPQLTWRSSELDLKFQLQHASGYRRPLEVSVGTARRRYRALNVAEGTSIGQIVVGIREARMV